MDVRMKRWMDRVGGWMDGWMISWLDRWMNGSIDRWSGERVGGWMDG